MRDGGRIAAAIQVLDDFAARRVPLRVALADWQRGARYAGAKDRAFVSGLCLDALRRWRSFGGEESARQAVALVLRELWSWEADRIAGAFGEAPHGPGALTADERATVPTDVPDAPDWLVPMLARTGDAATEIASLSARAPVDLRVNTLRGAPDKALRATETIGAVPAPIVATALRIPAPPAAERAPVVTVIPAYGKGLVEVQDEGSQIAALACGDVRGLQVLDLCAGRQEGAVQIHLHHTSPLLQRHRVHIGVGLQPGVHDDAVERSDRVGRVRKGARDVGLVRHVAAERYRLPARLRDDAADTIRVVLAGVVAYDDAGACLAEPDRDALPDAAAAAGDEDRATGQRLVCHGSALPSSCPMGPSTAATGGNSAGRCQLGVG